MAIRFVREFTGSMLVALLLFAAVVAWMLTSQSALDWAVDRVSAAYAGRLVIEEAQRTGVATLQVRRVRYLDPELRLDVRNASIDVDVVSLLRGRLRLRSLEAESIDLASTSRRDERPSLPQRLDLPLSLELSSLRVRRIGIGAGASALQLEDLDAGLSYDGDRHALTLRRLRSPWAVVSGRLVLGDSRPFPIDGEFSFVPASDRVGPVQLALAGDLTAMGAGVVVEAYGRRVLGRAAVLPFAAAVIARVEGKVDAFELRALGDALPRARLDLTLAANVDRSGVVAGHLEVVNREPGLLASERIPVVRLHGRFAGSGRDWALTQILLDAGRAGRLTGQAAVSAAGETAQLQAHALNLAALHAAMHPTALGGPIELGRRDGRLAFDARLREAGTTLIATGTYAERRVELARTRWSGPAGAVEASGVLALANELAFEGRGRLVGLNPARLGDFPAARLNADFSVAGRARPLVANVDARIGDSRFRDQPLSGRARVRVQPERIGELDLDLQLGRARAQAQGSFGAPGDRLAFGVDVPNARLIHPDARGSLRATGTASGTWREPAVGFELQASKLRYADRFDVEQVSAKGVVEPGGSGRVDVDVSARNLLAGAMRMAQVRFAVDGTRARHEARLTTRAADHRLEAALHGGLDAKRVWHGGLQALRVEGSLPMRLLQPVDLSLATDAVRIGSARIDVGGSGRIELASLEWAPQRGLTSRGSVRALELGGLQPLLPLPEAARSLVVAGQWDVSLGDSIAGSLTLTRESGDILIPGAPAVPARLRALRVDARALGTELVVEASLDSETFGRAGLTGSTRAERRGGTWGIAGDAPIQARLQADMPSLAWTRPLLDAGVIVGGRAALSLRASGSVAAPSFAGHLQARDLAVRVPDLGLSLRDGVLDATVDGQRLAIEALRFASGEGQVVGRGGARIARDALSAQIELTAQKLTVLARPDRLAVVSGRLDVAWDPRRLRATGQFTADRGVIELPREDAPRPSSDVVVLGSKPPAQRAVNVEADLVLDLGQNFALRGRGLDTRLAGTLRARVHPQTGIGLSGGVRAIDGTYRAFGRELSIRRGVLTFVGPADNPSLDILAVRSVAQVEVGVAVGGTALVPQIRLVSTPAMSDANKLAWLTLGHGLDETGRNEAAVLQAAALALLSRGDTDSQGTLANRFGLDELSFGTVSGTGEQVVSIGKRFASNFYVGFERGVTGAVSVIKITYDLSRRWSVQARAGSENAVDFFYTLGFR